MKDLCEKYQSILPSVKSIRKRPKKYKKRPKDPYAPKMPQSPFIFYFKKMKQKFQNEHKGQKFKYYIRKKIFINYIFNCKKMERIKY